MKHFNLLSCEWNKKYRHRIDKFEVDEFGTHFILQNVLSSEGTIRQGKTSVISNLHVSGLPTLKEGIHVRQV